VFRRGKLIIITSSYPAQIADKVQTRELLNPRDTLKDHMTPAHLPSQHCSRAKLGSRQRGSSEPLRAYKNALTLTR